MVSRRAATVLFLVQLIAFGAFAQSAEFGRGSGPEIVVKTKSTARLSGSVSLSLSQSMARGYAATAGGTLVDDRLWFFGSASRQTSSTRFADLQLPDRPELSPSFLSLRYSGVVLNITRSSANAPPLQP